MKNNLCRNKGGYIALLSTVIISAVLLSMTVGAGQSGWYTRFVVLGAEAKLQSKIVASGCIEEALAKLMIDLDWSGDATSTYGVGTCYVYPVQINYPQNQIVTIRVRGEVQGAFTNIISEFEMKDISLTSIPKAITATPPLTPSNILPTAKSFLEVGVMP